jgi:RNA polymerase sigma-70 factor, ECF subfamily
VIDPRRYCRRHRVRLTGEAADLDRPAAGDTAATAVENLSIEAVLELIATLPPHQAEVIVLRVVAGLDVGQVARITGRRPGAVRGGGASGAAGPGRPAVPSVREQTTESRQEGVTR